MSYISDSLMPDETLVYTTKLHWIVFFWPIILLFFLFPVFFPDDQVDAANAAAYLTSKLIVFSIFCLVTLSATVRYLTSEFGVTNKKVVIKTGFIRRKTMETLLTKIEGIAVDQGIFGRIFGYGTITISGTGGSKEIFKKIKAPLDFRKNIQRQISL